jgi:predicted enzyme involved in methoxymalonyl-ACP biosynthesis
MRSDTYRYYNKRLSIRLKLSIMRRLVISETCNSLWTTQQFGDTYTRIPQEDLLSLPINFF